MTDLQKNDFFQHISLSSKMTCPILFDPKCFGMLGQCMDRAVVGHGPRQILVLVGIHGNEPCGVEAAKLILQRQQVLCISDGAAAWGGITAQDLASARPCNKDEDCENESSLRWFPLAELYDKVTVEFLVGNPKALECNQRFLKRNLNRLFEVEKLCNDVEAEIEGYQYELQRARIVAESIRESNVILDIHSCSSDSPPFALPSSIDVSEELAASLPVKYVIESLVHNTAGGGTTLDFALSKQIPGVCVECGKHDHPDAVARAVAVISKFLLVEACMDQGLERSNGHVYGCPCNLQRPHPIVMRCEGVEIVHENFEWVRQFKEFEFIPYGEPVFRDDVRGLTCCTVEGGAYLVMPNKLPVLGEEALFWGVPADTQ